MLSEKKLEVLIVIMAGGEGLRLWPLTEFRTKPAVPIGGKYRLIDIPLSNAFNSRFRKVLVLTQGKDKSLNRHIKNTWHSDQKSGSFVDVISPQGLGTIYAGDADSVRQVRDDIRQHRPDIVLIVPGDHLLKMEYYKFVKFMIEQDADSVIAVMPKPLEQARHLGSLLLDQDQRIIDFREKDPDTPFRATSPDTFFASMGIYGFKIEALLNTLDLDGDQFGRQLIPQLIPHTKVLGFDYTRHNNISECIKVEKDGLLVDEVVDSGPDSHYWRDVGTISEYFEANMDLVYTTPKFNIYGREWPFYTAGTHFGPAKIIRPEGAGFVNSTIISEGSFLSDVAGRDLVISPDVFIDKSQLERVIIFNNSRIQRCNIRQAIIDKNVSLADMEIGFDAEADSTRGIYVDPESGIRVVRKFYNSREPETWRLGTTPPND